MKYQKIIEKILLGIFIIIAIFLAIPLIPIQGNYIVKSVQSGSMEPAIKKGSVIVIIPSSDYKIGDVVTFKKNRTPITHRVVDIKKKEINVYVTKGDANESLDMWEVYENDIIGKSVFSVPFLGYIVDFIKKPF